MSHLSNTSRKDPDKAQDKISHSLLRQSLKSVPQKTGSFSDLEDGGLSFTAPLAAVASFVSYFCVDSEEDVYSFNETLFSSEPNLKAEREGFEILPNGEQNGLLSENEETRRDPTPAESQEILDPDNNSFTFDQTDRGDLTLANVGYYLPQRGERSVEKREVLHSLKLPPPPGFNPDRPELLMGQHILTLVRSGSTIRQQPAATHAHGNPFPTLQNKPAECVCPSCGQHTKTEIVHRTGPLTWIVSSVVCCCGGCLGCFVIPFCCKPLKDIEHYCTNCGHLIRRFEKLSI